MLLEEGLKVHVVELPDGHDPDSFLKAVRRPTPTARGWTRRRGSWSGSSAGRRPRTTSRTPAGKVGVPERAAARRWPGSTARWSARPGCPRIVERGRPGRARRRRRSCGARSRAGRDRMRLPAAVAAATAAPGARAPAAGGEAAAGLAGRRRTPRASRDALRSCRRTTWRRCGRPAILRAAAALVPPRAEPVTPWPRSRTRCRTRTSAGCCARWRWRRRPRSGVSPARLRAELRRRPLEARHGGDPAATWPRRHGTAARTRCLREKLAARSTPPVSRGLSSV